MFGDPVRNERGWEVVDMDSVATKVTDGEHATPKRSDSGYLLLSARNIRNRTLDLSNVDHVEQAEFDRIYRRCNPAQGDILISCSGSIGRVTMVRTAEPFVLVRSVALIKPNTKRIDASYLEQYLLTDHMQATMNNSAKSSSQANLFTGPIKALPVMLPPISVQLKWKKAIEGVDAHRAMTETSLRRSEGLFGSLLQGAFIGGFGS
jgi:type I restriction enzyme S subunit